MSPGLRAAIRLVVIAAGVAVTVAGAFALRREDWPIYLAFVLLSLVLFGPGVEVVPSLTLPMPGLALCIGFLYVGGLPIVLLRNLAPPFLTQLLRWTVPERFRPLVPGLVFWRGPGLYSAHSQAIPRAAAAADWATFALGLGVRWAIVSLLAPAGRPAGHPAAMVAAELGGYSFWWLVSALPILSFRPVLNLRFPAAEGQLRTVYVDLGLIMILGLTPFVFLIAYGYETHGLAGAVVWSLSALGLHFMLQRLTERRLVVEEQNRRLEVLNRELEHRERLSAIGKMSSVVSHQMLQQLGVIGIHADLIRHAEAGDDPASAAAQAKTNAAAIEAALGDVNRVLRDLLVFSRDLRLNLYQHRLPGVLAECVAECRPAADGRGVTLRLDCPEDTTVTLDKLKLKQAIGNVLRNAIDASPAGGGVVVRAGVRDGWAEIAIADTGPGVPEADREAIFTPFFTTKEHGTGLGLAIARGFVEAHGGRLQVAGGAVPGATFVLRLPLGA